MAETNTDVNTGTHLPLTPDLCLKIPLYRKFYFEEHDWHVFWNIESFEGTMDCYCEGCGRHSVKRTPSSRQKRAIIKIVYYRYEPKYTDAGV